MWHLASIRQSFGDMDEGGVSYKSVLVTIYEAGGVHRRDFSEFDESVAFETAISTLLGEGWEPFNISETATTIATSYDQSTTLWFRMQIPD